MDLDPPAEQFKAKIYRQGSGVIDINGLNGQWPEGYSLKKDGGYDIKRTAQTDNAVFQLMHEHNAAVHSTWSPDKFTLLSQYNLGDYLPKDFKLVVHGLELKHLVGGLDGGLMSFDDFVNYGLNPNSPLGDEFIQFYPYFFHKSKLQNY